MPRIRSLLKAIEEVRAERQVPPESSEENLAPQLRSSQQPAEIDDHFFDVVERVPARRAAHVRRDDDVGEFDQRVVGVARFFVERVETESGEASRFQGAFAARGVRPSSVARR